jgi:hypothetical protein
MFRDGRRHLCRQLGVRLSIGPTLTRLTLGSRLRKSCESTNDGAHLERLGEKKQPMKRTGSNAFVALAVVLVVNLTAQARPTGDHVLLVGIDDLNDWIGCLSDRDAPEKRRAPHRTWAAAIPRIGFLQPAPALVCASEVV